MVCRSITAPGRFSGERREYCAQLGEVFFYACYAILHKFRLLLTNKQKKIIYNLHL